MLLLFPNSTQLHKTGTVYLFFFNFWLFPVKRHPEVSNLNDRDIAQIFDFILKIASV